MTLIYLKLFFLAGGPGSDPKTFVTKGAFGGTGLRVVNSDQTFENALKKIIYLLKCQIVSRSKRYVKACRQSNN